MNTKARPLNVCFVSAEVAPYAKVGGLADVVGSLPKALGGLGVATFVLAPRYENVRLRELSAKRKGDFSVNFLSQSYKVEIFQTTLLNSEVPLYLIDQPTWLSGGEIYHHPKSDPYFLIKRFIFFCRAAKTAMHKLKLAPDIIHAHDWMTSALCLKWGDERVTSEAKHLLTIHNIEHEAFAETDLLDAMGLPARTFSPLARSRDDPRFYNVFAQGILDAGFINTVSPTYAREILTARYGGGLERVLKRRTKRPRGILNGLDTDYFNPATDRYIAHRFSQDSLGNKQDNKHDLQATMGLEEKPEAFLCGVVSRLSKQKGIDLILEAMERTAKQGIQFAVLGQGNREYENRLKKMAVKFPRRVAFQPKYDSHLARKIYAGSDAFLMPSQFEPCGLAQLVALRYGTVPIVHDTGGLHDTVIDWRKTKGQGFLFQRFATQDFLRSLMSAHKQFRSPAVWQRLQLTAMNEDHSWRRSAQEYLRLYQNMLK